MPITDQQRHLNMVRAFAIFLAAGLVILGWVLYFGHELPFYDMRTQRTDSTGYAPPPPSYLATSDSIPRYVGVAPTRPVEITPPLPFPPGARIPPAPATLVNPLAGSPKAVQEGRGLYDINCAICHGRGGRGDGPVGQSYVPGPPDLRTYGPARSAATVYLSITYGIRSAPLPTTVRHLPYQWHAYRDLLGERERWAIAMFVQQGLPAAR